MALRSMNDRHAAPALGLDFERERADVEAWFERERRHVERLLPAPRPILIDPAPWLPLRNWIVALAVVLIVLGFALIPRPTVTSGWSGANSIVGQAHAVENVPYHGPAVISGEASPSR